MTLAGLPAGMLPLITYGFGNHLGGGALWDSLFDLINDVWHRGEWPEAWYEIMISYIYKGKGNLNELTSYTGRLL